MLTGQMALTLQSYGEAVGSGSVSDDKALVGRGNVGGPTPAWSCVQGQGGAEGDRVTVAVVMAT